jgi:AcrR family transcriptional regulator
MSSEISPPPVTPPEAPAPPAPPAPPATPPVPLTPERRRQQTREHLLQAAARVFAERGFHGATMDEVAAAAGFTKGAVYSNFRNKEDLFLALLDEHTKVQVALVREALDAGTPEEKSEPTSPWVGLTAEMLWGDQDWQLLSLEFLLYAARNEEARRKLVARERAMHDLLVPTVYDQLPNLVADEISADDLMNIITSLFQGISLLHLTDPETADERLVATAINFLNRAMVGPAPK